MSALQDAEILERLQPREYYRKWMESYFPVRPDQRQSDEFRETVVQTGTIGTCDASSTVRLGPTTVVTGIKVEVAEPAPSAPRDGFVVFNLTLAAGCSPSVRAGPPTDRAQLLTDQIALLLTALPVVCKDTLVITPGRLVWAVYIDAVVLNDAGNVHDAAWIGTLAALRELRLPSVRAEEETGLLIADPSRSEPLVLHCTPLTASFVYLQDRQCAIADPSDREEAVMAGEHVSFVVDGADPTVLLHSTSTALSLSPLLTAALGQAGVQRHFASLKSAMQL